MSEVNHEIFHVATFPYRRFNGMGMSAAMAILMYGDGTGKPQGILNGMMNDANKGHTGQIMYQDVVDILNCIKHQKPFKITCQYEPSAINFKPLMSGMPVVHNHKAVMVCMDAPGDDAADAMKMAMEAIGYDEAAYLKEYIELYVCTFDRCLQWFYPHQRRLAYVGTTQRPLQLQSDYG